MDREQYRDEYLQSEHWKTTRLAALERAGHRCQVCNVAKSLDVHHRTYERLGHEDPMDLTVLCRGCHDLFHRAPKKRRSKQVRKQESAQTRHRREIRETAISRISFALEKGPASRGELCADTGLSLGVVDMACEYMREQGMVVGRWTDGPEGGFLWQLLESYSSAA